MHLFIVGSPGIATTSLIKSLIKDIPTLQGFYTEEVEREGYVLGFKIVTLQGEEAVFAHKDFTTGARGEEYTLDKDIFERLAISSLTPLQGQSMTTIIADDTGTIEECSDSFKNAVEEIFATRSVIATAPAHRENSFLSRITQRQDSCVCDLRQDNFEDVRAQLKLFLQRRDVATLRAWDAQAQSLGLSERILIENASANLAHCIEQLKLGKRGVAVAGRGNNGADVVSCARKLLARGYEMEIIVIVHNELNEELRAQLAILEKIKKIHYLDKREDMEQLTAHLKGADFCLDGILGIGMRGSLHPFIKEVITTINRSGVCVISCDIPSGLSPQQGCIGEAICAQYTVTFLAPKEGFFKNRGWDFCGKIIVTDIGVSADLLERIEDVRRT